MASFLLISYEYPPFGGGGGRAMSCIAQQLARFGHEVTVLTGGGPAGHTARTHESGVSVVRVGSTRKSKSSASIFEMLSFCVHSIPFVLRSEAKNTNAIIAFFLFPTGPIALALKLRWGIPYVISLRGGDVPGNEPNLDQLHQLLYPVRRAIYRYAKSVVANSNDLARTAQKKDEIKVEVIPNGVDTGFFSPERLQKDRLEGKSAPVNFLFLGRFQRQKRVPELLEELVRIRLSHHLSFVLTLVGEGPEEHLIDRLVQDAGNPSWIRRYGWQDRIGVRDFYRMADCLINCSSYEGLPNTVIEAMACGTTVIASDIGPHRDLLVEGRTGFLVPLGNTNIFEKIIVLCATDMALVKRMGKCASAAVVNEFSWSDVTGAYEKLALAPEIR